MLISSSDVGQSVDIVNAVERSKLKFFMTPLVDTAGRLHVDEDDGRDQMSMSINCRNSCLYRCQDRSDAANTAKDLPKRYYCVVLGCADGIRRRRGASIRHITGKLIKFLVLARKLRRWSYSIRPLLSRILGMATYRHWIGDIEKA